MQDQNHYAQIEVIGARKNFRFGKGGGGVFAFIENGVREFGTFPFYAVFCNGKSVNSDAISNQEQLMTFVANRLAEGKTLWAQILVAKKESPVLTEDGSTFPCKFFSPYICIGYELTKPKSMQNSSKWAKFHQNPSTVGHNPTGMRETNYRLPPQATPNAFMNQSGNQPAQPSQNIDLRQRLEQRKRIDSHQGHHDDSSASYIRTSMPTSEAHRESLKTVDQDQDHQPEDSDSRAYRPEDSNSQGSQPEDVLSDTIPRQEVLKPEEPSFMNPYFKHSKGDKVSTKASGEETKNFSRLANEQKSTVRNFSRFENEPSRFEKAQMIKSSNISNTNEKVLNARNILRHENERPHAPLPRVIEAGNEVRRELHSGHDQFTVSDANNLRGSDRGYDKRPESDVVNFSRSDIKRSFPTSTIETEAPSSAFNPASSEALLIAEILMRRAVVNFGKSQTDSRIPIVTNSSELEVVFSLINLLNEDAMEFVGSSRGASKVQEIAHNAARDTRLDRHISRIPDEKSSNRDTNVLSSLPNPVRTTQKPHRSTSGFMDNDDSDDEDKGSVDRLDAIHRRMRPKSEVDLVFAQRAQAELNRLRTLASSSMQLDVRDRNSDASMRDEYLEKSRTLDSGRGGMAGHALGMIERWRVEQNWMSLKRRNEEEAQPRNSSLDLRPTEASTNKMADQEHSWQVPNFIPNIVNRAVKRRSNDPMDEASGGMYLKKMNPFKFTRK